MSETYHVRDRRLVAIDRVLAAAHAARNHWNEFGPEADFAAYMEALDEAITRWNRFWPGRAPEVPPEVGEGGR